MRLLLRRSYCLLCPSLTGGDDDHKWLAHRRRATLLAHNHPVVVGGIVPPPRKEGIATPLGNRRRATTTVANSFTRKRFRSVSSRQIRPARLRGPEAESISRPVENPSTDTLLCFLSRLRDAVFPLKNRPESGSDSEEGHALRGGLTQKAGLSGPDGDYQINADAHRLTDGIA